MELTGLLVRVVSWGTALLVVAAPLAIGGTRWTAQLALSGWALVLLALLAWARLGNGLRVPWPLWGPVALTALGLFQLVPLPEPLLAFLSPRAHEVLEYGLGDLGLYGDGQWRPLSLDPPSTAVATFHQAAFAAVAIVAANLERRRSERVQRAIAVAAALVAAIGFVHWGFGFERIYGWYEALDQDRMTGWFSTFVNENTTAGFLALGALTSLGLAAGAEQDGSRRLALAGAALAAAGAFLTGSRGGQAALLLGLVVFALLAHAPGGERADTTRARARLMVRVALVLGVIGAVLAVLLLPDWHQTVWGRPASELKVAAWFATDAYVADFWATGSGRGTFGLVYPQYQELIVQGTVSHPENIVLQLATEWGVLGAVVALATGVIGWVVAVGAFGREARPDHWGLMAGLAAAGAQQVVDFGFEAAGLSLPVAAAFGLALGRAARKRGARLGRRRTALAWGGAVTAVSLAGVLAWWGPGLPDRHPDAAAQAVRETPDEPEAILAEARRQVLDHPADYLLPLTVGARLAEAGVTPPAVLRWVNRALFLFPKGGKAHLLAARVLARAGLASQAALEYRSALAAEPWRLPVLVHEVAARFESPETLLEAVSATREAHRLLAEALLRAGQPARARAAMERVLAADPEAVDARSALARACAKLGDEACVEREAGALVAGGNPGLGHALLAELALRRGDEEAARAELRAGEVVSARDARFLYRAAVLYLRLGDVEAARRTLDRVWPLVALNDRSAAQTLALQGDVAARLDRPEQAMEAYRKALERDPRPGLARRAARQARALGLHEEAQRFLAQARRQGDPDAGAGEDVGRMTETDSHY